MASDKKRYIVLKEYKEMDDGSIFGYKVLNLDDLKIKYYSYYTITDIYTPHMLHEFNPESREGKCLLDNHLIFDDFLRTNQFLLPEDLIKSVYNSIDLNRHFNEENNLRVDNIDTNVSFLAINYLTMIDALLGDFNVDITSSFYHSLENYIGFYVDKYTWEKLDDENKKTILNAALHEVGHMEVTSRVLDDKGNILHLRTGFSRNVIDLEPIPSDDGIVYNLKSPRFNKYRYIENSLEEIANEYKCLVMTNNSYSCVYPDFGKNINQLLNNNLLKFRYGDGVQAVIEYLKETYHSSDDEIEQLLTSIMETQNSSLISGKANKVLNLISKLENKKR